MWKGHTQAGPGILTSIPMLHWLTAERLGHPGLYLDMYHKVLPLATNGSNTSESDMSGVYGGV